MESVIVNEPVDVGAVFARSVLRPKWFVWHKRKYQITETTYTWQDKRGETKLLCFAVTDGASVFELSLNLTTLVWRLEKTVTG